MMQGNEIAWESNEIVLFLKFYNIKMHCLYVFLILFQFSKFCHIDTQHRYRMALLSFKYNYMKQIWDL